MFKRGKSKPLRRYTRVEHKKIDKVVLSIPDLSGRHYNRITMEIIDGKSTRFIVRDNGVWPETANIPGLGTADLEAIKEAIDMAIDIMRGVELDDVLGSDDE